MSTPRPARPRKDQVRNRAALVAAARAVFAERGLDAPLDAIAQRACLGNATLYRHFPRREDLLVAVLLGNLDRSARALAHARRAPSGWAALTGYLDWLFTEQVANPAYLSALRAVPVGTDAEVDRLRDSTLADLETIIDQAKAEGAMRADRWVEDVFLVLALNEHLVHARHQEPAAAARRFLDLVLAAIGTSSTAGPVTAQEPTSVLALRRSLAHEVAGLRVPQGRQTR